LLRMRLLYSVVAFVVAGFVYGDDVMAADQSSEDIVRQLLPRAASRSFEPSSSKGVTVAGRPPDTAPAIDLTINFESGSSELTPDGKVLLDNLGRALKDDRLKGFHFRVEGHTDAKGSVVLNQRLSEQRAKTVCDALVGQYHIEMDRLESVGYGKRKLLDATNPDSGANRRVRVVNLGTP
jgi:OmpA-OmpF porin, OOP family